MSEDLEFGLTSPQPFFHEEQQEDHLGFQVSNIEPFPFPLEGDFSLDLTNRGNDTSVPDVNYSSLFLPSSPSPLQTQQHTTSSSSFVSPSSPSQFLMQVEMNNPTSNPFSFSPQPLPQRQHQQHQPQPQQANGSTYKRVRVEGMEVEVGSGSGASSPPHSSSPNGDSSGSSTCSSDSMGSGRKKKKTAKRKASSQSTDSIADNTGGVKLGKKEVERLRREKTAEAMSELKELVNQNQKLAIIQSAADRIRSQDERLRALEEQVRVQNSLLFEQQKKLSEYMDDPLLNNPFFKIAHSGGPLVHKSLEEVCSRLPLQLSPLASLAWDHSPVAMYIMSLDAKFIGGNAAFKLYMRVSDAQLERGISAREVLGKDDAEMDFSFMSDLLTGKKNSAINLIHVKCWFTGMNLRVSINNVLLLDDNSRPKYFFGTATVMDDIPCGMGDQLRQAISLRSSVDGSKPINPPEGTGGSGCCGHSGVERDVASSSCGGSSKPPSYAGPPFSVTNQPVTTAAHDSEYALPFPSPSQ